VCGTQRQGRYNLVAIIVTQLLTKSLIQARLSIIPRVSWCDKRASYSGRVVSLEAEAIMHQKSQLGVYLKSVAMKHLVKSSLIQARLLILVGATRGQEESRD
jgi:hypothetical protein